MIWNLYNSLVSSAFTWFFIRGLSLDINVLLFFFLLFHDIMCFAHWCALYAWFFICLYFFINSFFRFNCIWSISFHLGGSLRVLQAQIHNLIVASVKWYMTSGWKVMILNIHLLWTAFGVSSYMLLLLSCFSFGFQVFIWLYPFVKFDALWFCMNILLK